MTQASPELFGRRHATARRALWVGSALIGALLGWHGPDEGDLFWHMSLGRSVLRAGSRVVPEPYALGSLGEPRAVPEWLWGVVTYQIEQLGGFPALTALTMTLGALAGLLCARWVDRLCHERPEAAAGLMPQLALTSLMLSMLATRLRLRPELPALCIALGLLLQARDFCAQPQRERLRSAGLLLAGGLIWAQLHGSFVLAPALFVCCAGWPGADSAARRDYLALLLGLTLALLSSAHGVQFVQYIVDHAGGDGTRHMLDMRPPDHTTFDPHDVSGCALSLCALTWTLAFTLARVRVRDVALAALGLALFLTAVRFAVLLCLFALPLSVAGLRALTQVRGSWWSETAWARTGLRGLTAALACANLIWLLTSFDRAHPLLAADLPPATFPLRAAELLRQLPAGTAVYTPAMEAGSLIGFVGDGRLHASLDSRVPLHFDDAEYGAHRDSERAPEALDRIFRRFGFQAAIAPRATTVCRLLASRMRLVSVDPSHATFVTGEGSALPGLDPCSPEHLAMPCADAATLAASLRSVRAQRDDVYAAWLSAISSFACGTASARDALSRLPAPRALNAIRDAVVRWHVRASWRAGDQEQALAALSREVRNDDERALLVLPELWSDRPTLALTPLARRAVRDGDDFTPPQTRQRLAVLCVAAGDLECAYEQALRGAVLGDPLAPRVLELVAERHPSEHVRRNLRAWLSALRSTQR